MIKVIGFDSESPGLSAQIVAALGRVPKCYKMELEVIRYTPRGLNFYCLTGPGKRCYGVYYDDLRAICIRQFVSLENLYETLFHEIGHHVFCHILKLNQRYHWVTRIYPGSPCVTPYTQRNASEDFAESYMCYLTRSGLLAAIPENIGFWMRCFFKVTM